MIDVVWPQVANDKTHIASWNLNSPAKHETLNHNKDFNTLLITYRYSVKL